MIDRLRELFSKVPKKWLLIFACEAFLLVCAITYMRKQQKNVTSPAVVQYSESADPLKLSDRLKVNPTASQDIAREIRYIHDGGAQPSVTYYVQSPTIEKAAADTAQAIQKKDPALPAAASEKTDRTVVTPDPGKQKVDVYKINLRKPHKVKAGVMTTGEKSYIGVGYQQGRWEGMVYTRSGEKIEAGSLTYTVTEW